MPTPPITREMAKAAVDAVLAQGSIAAAARAMGLKRSTVQGRLDAAAAFGLTGQRGEANVSRWRPADEIIAARKAEFERYRAAGDGRTLRRIVMPDDLPFCIIALGDPHLDNPGTDLDLWERWTAPLNRKKGVYGFGGGDWLDNWLKVLAHLYATASTAAPEGWILLEHELERIGPHLIASVSGNHDDWSGHSDVLGMLMQKHGVLHRQKSLRVMLETPGGHVVTIGSRHRWPGRSMWNEVHAIRKAARMGQRDTILLGFDKHVSGSGKEIDPDTKRVTHCHQVGAFKVIDDYADDMGFVDRQTSPAVALVIDPTRPDTDPERVHAFEEPEAALDWLKALRRKRAG